ncbi:GNAT family N-acetyltransferase [Acerihabitans sp. TG2]|uniref:GNAT family N-acetyltransferase n=1 Tax=Acerihabitans sp. TG2 TaxID=3096008 RepID=UPI002B235E41|nr:GNAT family N-acetyltransferase [Acerihabitans sp. TG2]MEA9390145.1 GNAT family N-acetyltransferase [Acerihabitans sp. TG2]
MHLQSERLYLRPVRPSDTDDLFRIYGDPATNTFNPAGPYPDIKHAQTVLARWVSHWANNGFGNWAISLLESPEKIIGFGGLSISSYANTTINNLGYRFATHAWGKGLATEFALNSIRYGFDTLALNEISAVVRSHHRASQHVLLKSGLRYVREIHDVNNASPRLLFTLTRDEWYANPSIINGVLQ